MYRFIYQSRTPSSRRSRCASMKVVCLLFALTALSFQPPQFAWAQEKVKEAKEVKEVKLPDLTPETVAGVNRQTLNKVSSIKIKLDYLPNVNLQDLKNAIKDKNNWRLYAVPSEAQIGKYMLPTKQQPTDNPAEFALDKTDNPAEFAPEKLGLLKIQEIEVDLNDEKTVYLFYEDRYVLTPQNGSPAPTDAFRLFASQEILVGFDVPKAAGKAGGTLILSKKTTKHLWGADFDIPFSTDATSANATLLPIAPLTATANLPARPASFPVPQPEEFTPNAAAEDEKDTVTRLTASIGAFPLFSLGSGSFSNYFQGKAVFSNNNRDAEAGLDLTLGLFQRNIQAVDPTKSGNPISGLFNKPRRGGRNYKTNLYTVARKDEGLRFTIPVLQLRTTQPEFFGNEDIIPRQLLTVSSVRMEATVDAAQVLFKGLHNPLLRLSDKGRKRRGVDLGTVQLSLSPLDFVLDNYNYNFGSTSSVSQRRLRLQRPGGLQGPSAEFHSAWMLPLPLQFKNVLGKPQGEGIFALQWKLWWQHDYGNRNTIARKFVRGDIPGDFPNLRSSVFRNEFALVINRSKDKPVRLVYSYGFLGNQSFYDPFAKNIKTHWAFEIGL